MDIVTLKLGNEAVLYAKDGEIVGWDTAKADEASQPTTVGCLIIKDGKVLTGVRKSDFHPFEICGGGGHIEEGETPEDAAIRECQEEFGITPVDIMPIGIRTGIPEEYGVPVYFFATDYEGEIRCDDHSEMVAPHMSDLGEVLKAVQENKASLFPPFADSMRCLENFLAENGSNKPFSDENALTKGGQYHIIKMDSVEWKESEHPRDENGRFTSGGGSSGKTGDKPRTNDRPATQQKKFASSTSSRGKATQSKAWKAAHDAAKAKCSAVFPKNEQYSTGINYKGENVTLTVQTKEAQRFYNEVSAGKLKTIEELGADPVVQSLDELSDKCDEALGGQTCDIDTPERKQLREDICQEFLSNGSARLLENGKYAYDGEVRNEYKACIIIGLPAAGKSTLVDPLSQKQGMFVLDSDMVKEMMPEFAATNGAAANAVHEESGDIRKKAFSEFLTGSRKGDNLAIPIIGDNTKKVKTNYIDKLEDAGYDVEVKYVKADPQVSCNRVMSRAISTGRIIKSKVVLKYGSKPEESFEWFKKQKGKNGKPYVRSDA